MLATESISHKTANLKSGSVFGGIGQLEVTGYIKSATIEFNVLLYFVVCRGKYFEKIIKRHY